MQTASIAVAAGTYVAMSLTCPGILLHGSWAHCICCGGSLYLHCSIVVLFKCMPARFMEKQDLPLWWLGECHHICIESLCKPSCIGPVGRDRAHNRPTGGSQRGFGDLHVCLTEREQGLHVRVTIDSLDLIPDPVRTGREGALTLF